MNKANECTCPSGDGSLVHPCPAHPAVEQAGTNVGHGHVFPRADGVKMRCGGPALCSECAADAYRARAALAQPYPVPVSNIEFARKLFEEIALIADDEKCIRMLAGALTQPSPAPELESVDWASALLDVAVLNEALTSRDSAERLQNMDAGEVIRRAFGKLKNIRAQHDRIVGALRAVITQLRQHKNDYMDAGQETYRALQNEIREREAEIARLDGLVSSRTTERDAALARVAELERQEPVALANRGLHAFWVKWTEAAAGLYGPGIKLYAAPVAQAQHSVPVPVVTPEMVMAAMAVFRLDASPFKSMEAALIAALRKAAAPNEKRSCEYAGCCSTAHPGTSLCIAHHSKKVQEQLLAAAPGKEGV
ncbi:hypothetical protein [Pseudomonas aeruginosa]|uniref:hypothetical protein n=1 Tax=Pseudomonas aeruginosa TaxID=287 RepID=UPI0015880D60|nr:hypothetical protein [Pseudomonas aeruginosa]EIU1295295.1 hypothetical protein [Pseudomonas aeruginosa]EIU1441015.1 hypothetical protein [Pseudomonas aeruginosa]EIU3133589.1 hypothetical protein [Pseudomonas aeruginosa]EIU3952014.1 hypothetical protein [Pseudomonas aeruginosa]EIU3962424.1 hypothetical protein [Pseudomonas aeruginosa]